MDAINPNVLTIRRPKVVYGQKLPKHKKGDKFLKGPVPWIWLSAASQLSGKALHVSLAIWQLASMNNSPTVKLTSTLLDSLGVKRNAKYRALEALAKIGLIEYQSINGKNPVVTLLEPAGGGDG